LSILRIYVDMSKFAAAVIDAQLVLRLRGGDRAAAAAIYAQLAAPVHSLAARILGDPQLAAEVTQDTFIEVIEKAATVEHVDAFGGWVRRIAVNHCLARLRSPWYRRRAWSASSEADPAPIHTPRPDQVRDLEAALAMLSAGARFVVWMHDVEGYTHKEIGALLGKSESFSKSQLARAHVRLLAWFEGAESPGVEGDERTRRNGTG
jgi:RNA polymerase sigma-70 factor (ECF subfamily)